MRSVIEELWHGNLAPQEGGRINSTEMRELLGDISKHHGDLEKTLTDEQKEIFEKLNNCWSEYAGYAEEAIFKYAFKLGARMAVEVMDGGEK